MTGPQLSSRNSYLHPIVALWAVFTNLGPNFKAAVIRTLLGPGMDDDAMVGETARSAPSILQVPLEIARC